MITTCARCVLGLLVLGAAMLTVALSGPGLTSRQADAHELSTNKKNSEDVKPIIKHTHYTPGGHATKVNGKPANAFHKQQWCWIHGNVVSIFRANKMKPMPLTGPQVKSFKATMHKTWEKIFPGKSWKEIQEEGLVKQHKTIPVGYSHNCVSAAQGSGDVWIDPSDCREALGLDYAKITPPAKAKKDDLLVYKDHNGDVKHIAVIKEVNAAGEPTKVTSRMAEYGTYDHPPDKGPGAWFDSGTQEVYRKKA